MKKHRKTVYTISNVAGIYDIHPQTLRLYERQGLLKPSRSRGNTRLYTDQDLDQDLERLELILNLTRDLGVNLAGVEIILHMRAKMEKMQQEVREFMQIIGKEFAERSSRLDSKLDNALVRAAPSKIIRFDRGEQHGTHS